MPQRRSQRLQRVSDDRAFRARRFSSAESIVASGIVTRKNVRGVTRHGSGPPRRDSPRERDSLYAPRDGFQWVSLSWIEKVAGSLRYTTSQE